MATTNLPADELRFLLVTVLASATDGNGVRWDGLLGEMVRVDWARSPKGNWSIKPAPGCRLADRSAILQAVDLAKVEHPYVRW